MKRSYVHGSRDDEMHNDRVPTREGLLKTIKIGLDVGGVVCFDTEHISQKAINTITSLVRLFEPVDTYILSKAKHRMQLSILELFEDFDIYNKTGLYPSNVLFCQDRTTLGNIKPLTMQDMKKVKTPEGPSMARYAPIGYGKGAVAALFDLSVLVDDKDECLSDFRIHCGTTTPLLVQAKFRRRVEPSGEQDILICEDWDSVLSNCRNYVKHCGEAASMRMPRSRFPIKRQRVC